jgi:threonine/homoserine/homoserine lactone efflux protein
MDSASLAVRGLILGFSIAAVFGPIGLLCLRRTLASGFTIGFVSGLGAATADAAYAALAGLGISAVAVALVDHRLWLRLVGGAFLLYLGARTLRARPANGHRPTPPATGVRLAGAYSSTLALTLSNPMTILSFGAIFAGLGLGKPSNNTTAEAIELVLGVFGGSALWWLVLSGIAARLRSSFTPRRLRAVNVASGVLIAAFGVQALVAAAVPMTP